MARERAKTFADRLPPVVPKEEDDISRLSDEMVDILYPGRRPRPFRMGIAFDAFDGPGYERAVEAYLGALSAPPQARVETSLRNWYAGIERYPRQLHEMEQGDYLAMKRKEFALQQS